MKRVTFRVVLPDGREARRTSATKLYRFAVVAEVERYRAPGEWGWRVLRWSETARAAQNALGSFEARNYCRSGRVVGVAQDQEAAS